ncbi:MAG: alpha/beta hydrolase-fold protein [Anaerolineae bacterium]
MQTVTSSIQNQMVPLVKDDQVTWIWWGDSAPALIGDFNGWDDEHSIPLVETEPGKWTYTRTFERNAYMEYTFVLDGLRLPDPHNPRLIWNGIDAHFNWFRMPESVPSPYLQAIPGIPHGKIIREEVPLEGFVVGGIREVFFYKPPTDEPVPFIGVLDGPDYLRRAFLVNVVDHLIAQKKIRPIALIMVQNGHQARFMEYFANDVTAFLFAEPLYQYAQKHLNLIDPKTEPGVHGILGASMGGLQALHMGLRVPEFFGHVIAQSSAVQFQLNGHKLMLWDWVRWQEKLPLKIWMDVGKYEWLLESNREFYALLHSKGYEVHYREVPAGHNYSAWADQLADALMYQYGL